MLLPPSANQAVVLAREPDRAPAREGDAGRDPLVDRAAEDHLRDLHCRSVGDAQPCDERRLDVEPLEHAADLRAAAVDHDRTHAEGLQQRDVLREALGERRIRHRMAAVLHHDDLARARRHPAKRAHERFSIGHGAPSQLGDARRGRGRGSEKQLEEHARSRRQSDATLRSLCQLVVLANTLGAALV